MSDNGKPKETCESCLFWNLLPDEQQPPGQTNGRCRRMPPAFIYAGQIMALGSVIAGGNPQPQPQFTSGMPVSGINDWCGEYRSTNLLPVETRGAR